MFAEDIALHAHGDGCGKPVKNVLPLPDYAVARRLKVDWTRCDGHGLCAVVAPEIISLDANGFPSFPDSPVASWLEGSARKAVNMCPELALRLTTGGKGAPAPGKSALTRRLRG